MGDSITNDDEDDFILRPENFSELNKSRGKARGEIENKINSLPNNPEKIFKEFNYPVQIIDNVRFEGSGFKRKYYWNNREFKRPELVAKAFYEAQGYHVSWSEGVAWNIVIKSLMSILTLRMGQYFKFAFSDTRESALEFAISSSKMHQHHFDFLGIHGPSLIVERAIDGVNNRFDKRMEKLAGDDGEFFDELRHIILSIYDNDQIDFSQWTRFHRISSDFDIAELRVKLLEQVEELSSSKEISVLRQYFPKIGDKISNEYRDKNNLNEWTIKFAEEALANIDWRKIYIKNLEAHGEYATRFDLTLVNYETSEVRFVEVKVDDSFTFWQKLDLTASIHHRLPVELAVIAQQ